jgi:nucleoid DNA-binding protein
VVVPEFGGFVANYESAKIQSIHHKFSPPSKKISFNKNLKNNDGLLVNHIAERRAISYGEANDLIKSFVSKSIEGLQQGDKIHIEKVGTLYLDPERNIQFQAEEQNDFLISSFGLASFRATPIKREGAEERIKEQIRKSIPVIKEEEKKHRKRYWPAAAALCLVFASAWWLNTRFDWVDTRNIEYSSFRWNSSSEGKYKANSLSFDMGEDLLLPAPKAYETTGESISPYVSFDGEKAKHLFVGTENEKRVTEIDNTFVKDASSSRNLVFHVMGGCFSSLSNANGLVTKLQGQGFDARLLGTYKELHAVSFGSFATREEALSLLEKVRNYNNPDAWLLVKPF